jgi:hypothetical protein
VTPIAVDEEVDGDQTMMEAYADLGRTIRLVLDPVRDVAEQDLGLFQDLWWRDTNADLAQTYPACPGLDVTEHPPV